MKTPPAIANVFARSERPTGLNRWVPGLSTIRGYRVGLLDVSAMNRLYRLRRSEFVWSLACFLGVTILGAIQGIFIGVSLALLAFIWRAWRPHDAVLGRVDGIRATMTVPKSATATAERKNTLVQVNLRCCIDILPHRTQQLPKRKTPLCKLQPFDQNNFEVPSLPFRRWPATPVRKSAGQKMPGL